MKTKKVRPVLVEIKDASNIFENNDKTLSFYEYKQHASSGGKKFELILISLEDEEIEVGNKVFTGKHIETVIDITNKHGNIVCETATYLPEDVKKVIARQSQISPEYISKFIGQYNNGCIDDLEIEMEELYIYPDGTKSKISRLRPDAKPIEEPKLTNGFVTIVEKEYSHNLLCNMQYYMEYCQANGYVTPQDWLNKFKHYSDKKEPISYTEEECLKYCLKALEIGFDLNNTPLPRLNEKSGKQYFVDWFEQNKKK